MPKNQRKIPQLAPKATPDCPAEILHTSLSRRRIIGPTVAIISSTSEHESGLDVSLGYEAHQMPLVEVRLCAKREQLPYCAQVLRKIALKASDLFDRFETAKSERERQMCETFDGISCTLQGSPLQLEDKQEVRDAIGRMDSYELGDDSPF